MKKLPDLPASSDKEFWGDGEINTDLKPHSEISEDGHFFERITGAEAECKVCHWGFALDPGDEIKEGHLYTKGKLVI